jgi:hypothetical protein
MLASSVEVGHNSTGKGLCVIQPPTLSLTKEPMMPTLSVVCSGCGKRSRMNLSEGQTTVVCLACGEQFHIEASPQAIALPFAEECEGDQRDEPQRPKKGRHKDINRKSSRRRTMIAGSPLWAWALFSFCLGGLIVGGVIAGVIRYQQSDQIAKTGREEGDRVPTAVNPNGEDTGTPPQLDTTEPNPVTVPPEMFRPVPDARAENGWPVYEVSTEGFALAIPPDWRELEIDPEKFEANRQAMLKQNPHLKALFGDPRQKLAAGIKFYGLDESSIKTGLMTSVNVIRSPSPPWTTLDSAVADVVKHLENLPTGSMQFSHNRVKMATGEGEKFRCTTTMLAPAGHTIVVASTQFVFVAGTSVYVLSMVTSAGREAECAAIFEKMGQSFRLMKIRQVD